MSEFPGSTNQEVCTQMLYLLNVTYTIVFAAASGCLAYPCFTIACSCQVNSETVTANFVLSDNVYAVAEVPPTDTVYLWLGVRLDTHSHTHHTH